MLIISFENVEIVEVFKLMCSKLNQELIGLIKDC